MYIVIYILILFRISYFFLTLFFFFAWREGDFTHVPVIFNIIIICICMAICISWVICTGCLVCLAISKLLLFV